VFYVRNNSAQYMLDTLYSEGLAVGLTRVADDKHLEISVKESSRLAPFLALKVLQFPFINLVWLGTLLMITGFVMSIVRRVKLLS
jgi:cytochrome c-type biogenesis protein CcmF